MNAQSEQWLSVIILVVALLTTVAATVVYQPSAAKTGALLIKLNNNLYVMDIDSLAIELVAPAIGEAAVSPAPGCEQRLSQPCWVVVKDRLYRAGQRGQSTLVRLLTDDPNVAWLRQPVSWSPDGARFVYPVLNQQTEQVELHYQHVDSPSLQVLAVNVDERVKAAWSSGCAAGGASDCRLAYRQATGEVVALNMATFTTQRWSLGESQSVVALRWSAGGGLLYSPNLPHFRGVTDDQPPYHLPASAKLAGLSPQMGQMVYYHPFRRKGCADCLYLGVWLQQHRAETPPKLVYQVDLSTPSADGLTFVPTWSTVEDGFVFFQDGKMIFYDVTKKQAAMWHQSLLGRLRSKPVFSPNRRAVAFVDNQGQGVSEYRLVIVDPRLKPIEKIIVTESVFQVLTWLPDR